MAFKPVDPNAGKDWSVPFYEEREKVKVPGYDLRHDISYYQDRVRTYLYELGAVGVTFTYGVLDDVKPHRYAYEIRFQIGVNQGKIICAALPIKTETAIRKDNALKQALYLLSQWLAGEKASKYYRPGVQPLLPYIVNEADKTVMDLMVSSERFLLPPTIQDNPR